MTRPTGGRRGVRDRGETLIELLIAITLMAGMGAVFIAGLFTTVVSARIQHARADAHSIVTTAGEAVTSLGFLPCGTAEEYEDSLFDAFLELDSKVVIQSVEEWNGTDFGGVQELGSLADGSSVLELDASKFPDPATSSGYQIKVGDEFMNVVSKAADASFLIVDRNGTKPALLAEAMMCSRLQRFTLHADAQPDGPAQEAVIAKRGPLTSPAFSSMAILSAIDEAGADDVSISAVLADAANPTGTIVFSLYGPADPTCAGTPSFSDTVPVSGNGTYPSGPAHPADVTNPGTYRWQVSYSGDPSNPGIVGTCGPPGQTIRLDQVTGTTSTPSILAGQTVTDSVTLATPDSPVPPTGTVTFKLYGPGDPGCTGASVDLTSVPVTAAWPYTAPLPDTVLNVAGDYRWRAFYIGDMNNAAASTPCAAPTQLVHVGKAVTNLVVAPVDTTATAGAVVHATGTLTGYALPAGSVTFHLYDNSGCAGTAVADLAPTALVDPGTGATTSPDYTVTVPVGTYFWGATYGGDANNEADTECGATAGLVVS